MACIVVDKNTSVKNLRKLMDFDLDGTLRELVGQERMTKMSALEKSLVRKFNDAELSSFVNRMAV